GQTQARVNDDVFGHPVPVNVSDQVLGGSLLDVHINPDLATGQVERLIEGRNPGSRELRAGFDAGVQLPDVVEGHFRDFPLAVGPTLDVAVMAQNQLSVGGCADIHFDEIGTQAYGFLERRNRV